MLAFTKTKPPKPDPPLRNDYVIKLLLIGDSGVGKTCLLIRFTEDSFRPSFIGTIGIDFRIKTIEYKNCILKLQIWDTAGQEKFRTITSAYYRNAMGILLVYDITSESSFNNVTNWMKNIKEYAPETVCTILVGNKCDSENDRVITADRGEKLASEFGIPFIETSARTRIGVEEAFLTLAKEIFERLYKLRQSSPTAEDRQPQPRQPVVISDSIWSTPSCCSN
eukprot:TRINITY_DN330_c0_g6_i1.p1 TRINITY_DN330_c0_g6~~TRINITY_DN330_c0_g6_i1.p1  ORF type:complete len:223 (+),score=19.23 TRINITY_DN330_c0_g6_i1:533-1201(+)